MTIYGATNQPTQATHHGQPEGGKVGDVHTKLCGCAMAGAMQQAGHQAGVAPQDINKAIDALWQAIAGIKQQAGGGAAGGMGGAGDLNQMMKDVGQYMNPQEQGNMQRGVGQLTNLINQLITLMQQWVQDQENTKNGGRKGDNGGNGGNYGNGGGNGAYGAGGGNGGGTGGTGTGLDVGGDWFTAIARALGKTLNQQAGNVRELSDQLSGAVGAAQGQQGDGRADAQNAIMELQTQLSAESQRMAYLSQGINTALTAIGNALSTLGRDQ